MMTTLALISCSKNDPITELGETNNEFSAQLRVTYSNTKPVLGDSLVLTASFWQRDDKFKEVNFMKTVVESFGLNLKLKKGTNVITKTEEESTLIITDTIFNDELYQSIKAEDLDKYWTTSSNNYIIKQVYKFNNVVGKYPEDNTLISNLDDNSFNMLKGILAYKMTKDDYLDIFPSSPANHYSGALLTLIGRDYMKANMTKAQLLAQTLELKKLGSVFVTLDVDAVTPTGAITSATRTFDYNY